MEELKHRSVGVPGAGHEPFSEVLSTEPASTEASDTLSKGRTIVLIVTLTGTVFVGSMNTGVMTVTLPRISTDLEISSNLRLWFVSSQEPI